MTEKDRVLVKWKRRFSARGVSAKAALRALNGLARTSGGITPASVLESARSKDSALHDLFTWDDGAAAEAYRLSEAMRLVSNVTLVRISVGKKPSEPIRAFVNVRAPGSSCGHHYVPIERLEDDADLRRQVLQDAIDDMKAVKARVEQYSDLAALTKGIGRLIRLAEKESD